MEHPSPPPQKNKKLLKEIMSVVLCALFAGKSLEDLPILVADVNSEQSLLDMCDRARVILNCVGPVRRTLQKFMPCVLIP